MPVVDSHREYGRHDGTGHVWAVELNGVGIARCCGPVPGDDAITRLLPFLNFETRDVVWLRDHITEFTRLDDDGPISAAT